jgi:N-acetylmuramoyl-L-alanine amidase
MGLARSKGNLEIAKQENSVILLEKDYKQTYKGFDPKTRDSNLKFFKKIIWIAVSI